MLSDKLYAEGLEAMQAKRIDEAEIKFKQALSYKHDHSKTLLQVGFHCSFLLLSENAQALCVLRVARLLFRISCCQVTKSVSESLIVS